MSLKNLQMFQPLSRERVYHHRQATPLRAPPSALSRNISRSAETLVATTRWGKKTHYHHWVGYPCLAVVENESSLVSIIDDDTRFREV